MSLLSFIYWQADDFRSYVPPELSLGFMSQSHPVRSVCIKIVTHKYSEWAVFVIVLVSCVLLAMEEPGVKVNYTQCSFFMLIERFLVERLEIGSSNPCL